MATRQSASATNAPGVYDKGNQAYSDSNAPMSLEMTQAGEPGAVPAGEAILYSPTGKVLMMKAPDGTITTIGPGASGSAPELAATSDYTSTTPTAPATGIKIFSRTRARRLPASIGPAGQDTTLQPALFSNRVGQIKANNASATLTYDALPAITAYTANTAVTAATTSLFASLTRTRFPGGSTIAATQAGFRHGNLVHLSATPNKGGFFWVLRCGVSAGQSGGGRGVFGIFLSTAALAAAEPSAGTSFVGFGWGNADTTQKVYTNDTTGTATTVADLGASFPTRDYGVSFFEYRLFAPSGAGNSVYWSATRVNDGASVHGGPITTDLPAVDTLLGTQAVIASTAASTISLDVQSLYIETDN